MHVNIPQGPLYTGIYRKIAAPQIKPRTQTHSLCQPGQSKCASTFHKSNFIRKFTGKMPRPKTARRLCASLHRWHALQRFTRATLHRNLPEKSAAPQNRGADFVQPAQSKIRKFTGKMPRPRESTLERAPWSSTGLYTVRTPQCGHAFAEHMPDRMPKKCQNKYARWKCQKECQIECQKRCRKECQNRMSECHNKMSENKCHIYFRLQGASYPEDDFLALQSPEEVTPLPQRRQPPGPPGTIPQKPWRLKRDLWIYA